MPRRSILSSVERESLLALPESPGELIRLYTFSDANLSLGWDHINLTGDYTWRNNRIRPGKFRQLRPLQPA